MEKKNDEYVLLVEDHMKERIGSTVEQTAQGLDEQVVESQQVRPTGRKLAVDALKQRVEKLSEMGSSEGTKKIGRTEKSAMIKLQAAIRSLQVLERVIKVNIPNTKKQKDAARHFEGIKTCVDSALNLIENMEGGMGCRPSRGRALRELNSKLEQLQEELRKTGGEAMTCYVEGLHTETERITEGTTEKTKGPLGSHFKPQDFGV